MAILMGDLRAALVSAGAPDDRAGKAVTDVATDGSRLASVGTKLSVPTWMVGANIAITTAVMFRVSD